MGQLVVGAKVRAVREIIETVAIPRTVAKEGSEGEVLYVFPDRLRFDGLATVRWASGATRNVCEADYRLVQ